MSTSKAKPSTTVKTPTKTATKPAASLSPKKTIATKPNASAPKTTAAAAATPENPVSTVDPSLNNLTLRKRELIDKVVKRSGIKKKDAKPVVEAMLAELGETLAAGRDLALPPLGRVKINRRKDLPNGQVLIVKVRQTKRPKAVTLGPVE